MNFYEAQVIKLQNRIKKIEANPDPTRLKSNKMRYERQLKMTKEKVKATQQGKVFYSGGSGAYLGRLIEALGFVHGGADDVVFAGIEPQKYLQMARDMGINVDQSCDMVTIPLAAMDSGDVPLQDFSLVDNHACTAMCMRYILVEHTHNIPFYHIDLGFDENDANLEHVTEQLKGFVDFAEKRFPGRIKYDEKKLIRLQKKDEALRAISLQMYEMLKHRPSPLGGKDHADAGGTLEIAQVRLEELRERMAKGIGSVPGEKLRVLWTVTNPVFMNVYNVMAKWKINVLMQYSGPSRNSTPIPRPVYFGGRELTPLEKEAANYISELWAGRASKWIDGMIWIARDLQVDAIVNYNMLGCAATLGMAELVERAVEKELGIPVLQLEGSQWNSSYADEATITAKLDEFAQMLLSQRGLA